MGLSIVEVDVTDCDFLNVTRICLECNAQVAITDINHQLGVVPEQRM